MSKRKFEIWQNGKWVPLAKPVTGIYPGDQVPDEYLVLRETIRQLRLEAMARGGRFPSCMKMLPRRWKQLHDEMREYLRACGYRDPEPLQAPIGEPNVLVLGVPIVVAPVPATLMQ